MLCDNSGLLEVSTQIMPIEKSLKKFKN
jgi:hypothetical protein